MTNNMNVINSVTFEKTQGGLARTAPGEDHISGMLFFGDYPSSGAMSATKPITQLFSLKEAEAKGILDTEDATKALHYQIAEFFRVNPTGVLWLGLYKDADTTTDGGGNVRWTFNEVKAIQSAASGKIRQIGVYSPESFNEGYVSTLQSRAEELAATYQPTVLLYAADSYGVLGIDQLPNLRATGNANHYVSVVIGQDGKGAGSSLAESTQKAVPCLGACLGTLAKAQVHQNIGWVQEFDVAGGFELDSLALAVNKGTEADPEPVTYNELSEGQLKSIHDKGYIFLRKHIGISGSYFNDSHTATDPQSDFAYIENNRSIDKAIRGIRRALLPQVNSPLYVDGDGKLSFDTITFFETLANRPLEQMRIDQEVSNYEVSIDPNQNVLADSTLNINVRIIPVGVARYIHVTIGFAVSLA